MKLPEVKNDSKYFWTEHSKFKMRQYGLSAQRIKRIIRAPKRIEEGVVKKTIAVMQPVSTKIKDGKEIWNQEIWAMYQAKSKVKSQKSKAILNSKPIKIISAWRYPGMSPKNNPIPEDILEELAELC